MTRPNSQNKYLNPDELKEIWDKYDRETDAAGLYCVASVYPINQNDFATIRFEAKSYFCDCDSDDIKRLIDSGWGGSEAKRVAVRIHDQFEALIMMFRRYKKKDLMKTPVRCTIDPVTTLVWMRRHRPELISKLVKENPEMRFF
jgi:hypothetical protein